MKIKITQEQLDNYNKKYNTSFKLEDADKNSNIGCDNCTNCDNCLGCFRCSYCSDCSDCYYCYDCYDCYYCYYCKDWSRCSYHIKDNKVTKEECETKIKEFNNED